MESVPRDDLTEASGATGRAEGDASTRRRIRAGRVPDFLPNCAARVVALVTSVFLFLSGCSLGQQAGTVLTQAEAAVDGAIAEISANVSNWQRSLDELNQTLAGLDDAAARLVRTEVQQLTERTIAATGIEARCTVDFLGHRVLEGLNRVRSHLLGVPAELEPRVCSVSPTVIDMNLEPAGRNKIEVAGYNFDTTPPMRLLLTTSTGVIDVSKHLSVQTHYKAVVVLGGDHPDEGLQLDRTARALQVVWKNTTVATEIRVSQPGPAPQCTAQRLNSNPVEHTLQARKVGRGDADLKGKAEVSVEALREGDSNTIIGRVIFRVQEYDVGDGTQGEATAVVELFRAPPGMRIKNVAAPLADPRLQYRDLDHVTTPVGGTGGLVRSYLIDADRDGDDLTGHANVIVSWRSFVVEVIPLTGCRP